MLAKIKFFHHLIRVYGSARLVELVLKTPSSVTPGKLTITLREYVSPGSLGKLGNTEAFVIQRHLILLYLHSHSFFFIYLFIYFWQEAPCITAAVELIDQRFALDKIEY